MFRPPSSRPPRPRSTQTKCRWPPGASSTRSSSRLCLAVVVVLAVVGFYSAATSAAASREGRRRWQRRQRQEDRRRTQRLAHLYDNESSDSAGSDRPEEGDGDQQEVRLGGQGCEPTPISAGMSAVSRRFSSSSSSSSPLRGFWFLGTCIGYLHTTSVSAAGTPDRVPGRTPGGGGGGGGAAAAATLSPSVDGPDVSVSVSVLYVGILSGPFNALQRSWCRATWTRAAKRKTQRLVLRFFVGVAAADGALSAALIAEAARHGDLAFVDTADGSYRTALPVKVFTMLSWFTSGVMSDIKNSDNNGAAAAVRRAHLFKTDDDSYLSLDGLATTLDQFDIPSSSTAWVSRNTVGGGGGGGGGGLLRGSDAVSLFSSSSSSSSSSLLDYGGYIHRGSRVGREGDWSVPHAAFSGDIYPPYAAGAGYVLSFAAARCALRQVSVASTEAGVEEVRRRYSSYGVEDVMVAILLDEACPSVRPIHLTGVTKRPSEIATDPWWHWWHFGMPARLFAGQLSRRRFPPFLFHHLKRRADFEEAANALQ